MCSGMPADYRAATGCSHCACEHIEAHQFSFTFGWLSCTACVYHLQMRVSKEVAALRDFEQSLLRSYQAYLKSLLAAATAKPSAGSSSSVLATARVAVRCLGQLLVARPGFNYGSDILQVRTHWCCAP